ncbi:hypothetical protein N8T08_000460 [Aspergillus melleus]|uniref:Uncharacterized protein n=1 Tax=Aspergillus melleus TaxID=138277 RepID=A0ACC3BBP7_9EURO|nr:hypothetical protein N8T08_000460 [Aspergillus melleus]
MTGFDLDTVPPEDGAIDVKNETETAFDAEISLHDQMLMDQCLRATMKAHHSKHYSRKDISLEAKAFETSDLTVHEFMANSEGGQVYALAVLQAGPRSGNDGEPL